MAETATKWAAMWDNFRDRLRVQSREGKVSPKTFTIDGGSYIFRWMRRIPLDMPWLCDTREQAMSHTVCEAIEAVRNAEVELRSAKERLDAIQKQVLEISDAD